MPTRPVTDQGSGTAVVTVASGSVSSVTRSWSLVGLGLELDVGLVLPRRAVLGVLAALVATDFGEALPDALPDADVDAEPAALPGAAPRPVCGATDDRAALREAAASVSGRAAADFTLDPGMTSRVLGSLDPLPVRPDPPGPPCPSLTTRAPAPTTAASIAAPAPPTAAGTATPPRRRLR
ncbi:MAG TPA: hypothetical protein VF314_05510 [Actinomycetes bacterium]